ncbi:p450 domain containing protein [Asbolus verrucosus]|uniref:p450 domain containing protein n=1 Tax=Asbolus verrucosus TaxID=1661398 RepID=A0A482VXH7_ASBVE|nr:p450 domain containing protein [Asbolus verrucosus]
MLTLSYFAEFAALFAFIFILLYSYFTRNFNYWKNKNVPYLKPLPFFGNVFSGITMRHCMGELFSEIYRKSMEPFVGFFMLDEPCLLFRDPKVIKRVLVNDFQYFYDRKVTSNKRDDPISAHVLFILKNPEWKEIRTKVTPVFTSSKMKNMSKLIEKSAKELVNYLSGRVKAKPVLEMKEVCAKFTVDVISSTSFGVDANCLKDEDSQFRVAARKLLDWDNFWLSFQMRCYFLAPKLVKLFRMKFFNPASAQFLKESFLEIMEQRGASDSTRNDLIDILLQIKKNDKQFMDGDILVAQAVQFFAAGFETSSAAICFTLYELAGNLQIQQKLRQEISEISGKHGDINYDAINEMDYLNMCVKGEALRKYPTLAFLDRKCNSDYKIPETDIVIDKGTSTFISILALHYDPQYFPDPEKFVPERFSKDGDQVVESFAYLPFGGGPRNCIALYFYFTRKFSYWKDINVPYIPPVPFFGNAFNLFTFRQNIGEMCRQIYESTTKPFIGFFVVDEPCLLIRDPELVKSVLVKDFGTFNNRTITENKKDDPMGSHILFILKTPDWRDMRRKLTPVFTSGKMKWMYHLIKEAGEDLLDYLEKEVPKKVKVDIREVSAKYTTDAITSTSFGINANCFKNENAEFRLVSRRVFNWSNLERAISTSCYFVAPTLVKLFKMKFIDSFSSDFLRNAFWKTISEREQRKFVRNDLIDILIEMKNKEAVDDPLKLEGDKLVAQATQFFIAGFETTSSTISFTLYELAIHKDIQKKLREEIISVRDKHGGFTYDALKEMEYLDLCIKETLRKYPVLPFLDRRCNVDYTIPGTDTVLKKGSAVFVSLLGLHYDPKYFPDPERYDPSRHTEENAASRPQFSYIPFGEGPRNCIGARFGLLSSKSGVAHILSQFEVDLCEETKPPIKLDPKGILLAPLLQLLLKFKKYEE